MPRQKTSVAFGGDVELLMCLVERSTTT